MTPIVRITAVNAGLAKKSSGNVSKTRKIEYVVTFEKRSCMPVRNLPGPVKQFKLYAQKKDSVGVHEYLRGNRNHYALFQYKEKVYMNEGWDIHRPEYLSHIGDGSFINKSICTFHSR